MSPSIMLSLGVLLFAMGFGCMLYGITCVQFISYFRIHAKTDAWWLKTMTTWIWILNTLQIALLTHVAYNYLINAPVNPELFIVIVWSIPACALIMVLISATVYSFYTWRLWILSKGNYILCSAIVILNIGDFAGGLAFFISGIIRNHPIQEMSSKSSTGISILVAAGFGVTMNMLVAVSMCWILAQNRTGCNRTDSAIDVLMVYTISTGLVACLVILSACVMRIAFPDTFLGIFFLFLLPSFHANAYLASLNGRQFFRRPDQDTELSKID